MSWHFKVVGIDPVAEFDDYFGDLRQRLGDQIPLLRSCDTRRFVSGHYRLRDARAALAPLWDSMIRFTFLRDPVARFVSDYVYSTSAANLTQGAIQSRFPEFEAYLNGPGQVNKQVQYLAPEAGASTSETLDFMRENLDMIGLTESYEDHADIIFRTLGLQRPDSKEMNVSRDRDRARAILDQFGPQISEAHAEELHLVEAVRQQWARGS